MSRQPADQPFRTLFTEQARQDRQSVPSFEDALRPQPAPRIAVGRLTGTATLLLFMGISVQLVYRSVTTTQPPPPQPLPNLLDALNDTPADQWQSPTAFLLDMSFPAEAQSAPSPGQDRPQTRNSNG